MMDRKEVQKENLVPLGQQGPETVVINTQYSPQLHSETDCYFKPGGPVQVPENDPDTLAPGSPGGSGLPQSYLRHGLRGSQWGGGSVVWG